LAAVQENRFRIGEAYHVEPSLNRVTGPGGVIRLEPKVMIVLSCLADHAGEMVSKERLLNAAWADVAVGDDVLIRAISELRRLFDDDPKQPRIIETIPKAGYRLIAPVTRPESNEPPPEPTIRASWFHYKTATIAAASITLLIGIVGTLWLRPPAKVKSSAPSQPRLVQLTAFRGLEMSPTFSPDGMQVAFSWNGEKEDNFDIYLKIIGLSEVRRLTADSAPDVNPVWSPDGRQIAFVRQHPDSNVQRLEAVQSYDQGVGTIHVVSPLGGADRRLSDFRVPITWPPDSCSIAWSPDGRWLAASGDASRDRPSENPSIYLIPAAGGAPRALTHAKPHAWDVAPAFSPDGHRLAYASCDPGMRVVNMACDVYVVDLGADYVPVSPPRRLTTQGFAIQGLAWSRDGASIIYDTSGRGPFQLWRVMADGTQAPDRLEVAGFGSRKPATAPSRDRLVFERKLLTMGVYTVRPGQTPQPLLVSSVFDFDPQFSPDGRRLAFASRRSGEAVEIWAALADGSSPQQLTHGPGARQNAPAWSPDGQQIAFAAVGKNGHWDVWLMESDGGSPRQLTADPGDENMPTWSRDGRWIYFSSDRGGRLDIWRTAVSGGPSERVTSGGSGMIAYESPDGNAIVYQAADTDSPLLALPLAGGPARQLVRCVKAQSFTLAASGIYYAPCDTGPEDFVHLLNRVTGRDRVLASVSEPFHASSLAVSPDGTRMLVHRYTENADLMLLENFR
jgi:Tol biopolymer transport system component/DNA-binding winged helix-turn-helix (wHTH) protein